ncbi:MULTISPECIES: hypothetical protein [unclassified Streptomyces]|uniref:hypothetical protein n=1 Tax=unclassified Streptomyces TaxID=2593676 RepID=UPI002E2BB8A0|nr:hypothetical protein [Streptomyces sp. NBC_01429]
MVIPLWVLAVLIPELVLTCVLLRWLPVRRERWIPAMPLPVIVMVALALRFGTEASWQVTLATCAGFLWGAALAVAPFRGWVSSWTLPQEGQDPLRWREMALVVVGVVTPLSFKGTDAALEKTFAVRQVIRARGQFPPAMGVALLVLPVAGAVGAGWGMEFAGWA